MGLILSLDMATKKTGWAIFSEYDKKLIDYGLIRTESLETKVRIKEIYLSIKKMLIDNAKIENIIFEDVPLTNHNNLKTGKDLSILQGVVLSLCFENNLGYKMYNPSAWRSIVGLYNGTRESMKREFQKNAAVNKVNDIYGFNFVYNETETKERKTDDDKAEAILIGLAYLESKEEI